MSSIDHKRNTLSKYIFDDVNNDYPLIKSQVQTYILNRVESIEQTYGYPINEVFMIGSILTKQYRNDADVDINLFFDVPFEEQESFLEEIYEDLADLNGHIIPNTEHILNFYVVVDEIIQNSNLEKADSVFSITNNMWVKKGSFEGFNHQSVYDSFSGKLNEYLTDLDLLKGEIKRDIIDYTLLDTLTKEDVSELDIIMDSKLEEIEENMVEFRETITGITQDRRDLFTRELTPEEIVSFKKHNNLPTNIIYKLLEKYHYIEFSKKIKKILEDDIIEPEELEDLTERVINQIILNDRLNKLL